MEEETTGKSSLQGRLKDNVGLWWLKLEVTLDSTRFVGPKKIPYLVKKRTTKMRKEENNLKRSCFLIVWIILSLLVPC